MSLRVEPSLLKDLDKFGAFDIQSCFNCGNCTAVCTLSEEDTAFPRRMIRYAQLGLSDHLISSKELWLCYYCGACSDTCPRQAEPGEFMASARRLAVSRFEPTGLARLLYVSPWSVTIGLVLLTVVFSMFMLVFSPGVPTGPVSTSKMLDFIPYELIHWSGIGILAFMGLASVITVINMVWSLANAPEPWVKEPSDPRPGVFPLKAAVISARNTCREILFQSRYQDCNEDEYSDKAKPWFLKHWFIHWSIMIGFFGLGAATGLDYMFKDPHLHVPLWYPIRLLGTVSGLLLIYGSTVAIVNRLRQPDKYYARSHHSDWIFLGLLWLVGLTGFVLETVIYLPVTGVWAYVIFLLHVVLAMELLVLFVFTKFAHAVYRPLALWFYDFNRIRKGVRE